MITKLIQSYGLSGLLTEQDDAALWEAALQQHWPAVNSPNCLVNALRFNIGRRLAEGEQPQGETNAQYAKMRGMVDIEEWCFERVDDTHLQIKQCTESTGVGLSFLPSMGLAALMSGQVSYPPPAQVVFMFLGISRPSWNTEQAVVYAASSAPGVGDGSAYFWQRQADRQWEPSDQRVAWWIT